MNNNSIKQTKRYSTYLKYLLMLKKSSITEITSKEIANEVGCSEETVRKDLQSITDSGTPGQKRNIDSLIYDLEKHLGYHEKTNIIIIGIGNLGKALINYAGFNEYGIKVVAGFDLKVDDDLTINNINVYNMSKLEQIIKENNVTTAVLTTRRTKAQELVDELVDYGIKAIYNFVPLYLKTNKEDVIIENIDIASSIAFLSLKSKGDKK